MLASYKVLLLGASGVGKTSLMRRDVFNDYVEVHKETVGCDFIKKTVKFDDNEDSVNLLVDILWDTAGTERYASISSTFYRGADIIIFVFDITNHKSFESLEYWEKKFREIEPEESIPYILAANKCDDENVVRAVDRKEIELFCEKYKIPMENFLEVSAKTCLNTSLLFELTARLVVKHRPPTKKHSRRDSIRLTKIDNNETDDRGRAKGNKCKCSIM